MNVQTKALKNHKAYPWRYDGFIRPFARPSFSFSKPNPNCGYGRILLECYKLKDDTPTPRRIIQIRIGKEPTSSSETYRSLVIAGLLSSSHKGYKITALGEQYVKEMLKDYI